MLIFKTTYAQQNQSQPQTHYYYIEEASYDLLKPKKVTENQDGVLIYSGSDFTVSSLVAKEYKLEVIADYDGHIDYKTVETEDKRGIEYLSPNPASTTVDIGYFISEHDNGYIMLTHSITGLSYNYVLNSTNTNQVIPVDQLASGTYIVNLVANGGIIATENLIIN